MSSDRTPILICGDSDQEVEDFINELNLLINFRTQIIFYTDFVDTNDYINLIENEENDFEIQRSIFICYPFAIEKIIETVPLFNSWILGISNETQLLYTKIKEFLFSKQDYFLNIDLDQKVLKTQIEGKKFPNLKLDFEKTLYQNAINNTEIAIERMRRVISKKIDTKKMPKDLIRNILNFSLEEKDLQINLIKKEITDFYQACKRAFNILNCMKNLETYGLKSQISSKTLYNTVAYEESFRLREC